MELVEIGWKLLALCLLTAVAGGAAAAEMAEKGKPVVPLRAEPFPLSQVRLLAGPFQHAQEMDRRYLLSLDPDRLLHNFRVTAGLPSSAKPLGGWEAPDCEVRGHFVGHYLSACAEMVAATGDATLRRNADYVVAEMAKCQQALGSGYLSAYPESLIDRVVDLKPVWAPWYTLHKIHAGLLDMYRLCGNRQALEVARKFGDWAKQRMDRLTDEQMQAMLRNEHGGINESLANLYALTGDRDYLALSLRFNHHALLDPLAQHKDTLTGLHANTQIPKFIGAARQYELTGRKELREAAAYFWQVVAEERSYVIGGHSDGEMFTPKEKLSEALGPNTTETCNTFNMLRLTRHLFQWDPRARYADFYERALYNHILASQNPETGMMCYYVPLRAGSHKVYNTPLDSFWCCTGTGIENHAKYGDSIYFHEGGKSLYVNLFIASELTWKEKGMVVRQVTAFPRENTSRLLFTCEKPVEMTLNLRYPAWVAGKMTVLVNGQPQEAAGQPGSYVAIRRRWQTGDFVEVTLPMALRTEAFRDNPRRLAFLYGPIVLCAAVGEQRPLPAVVTPDDRLLDGITPVPGQPLTFAAAAGLFRVAGEPEGPPITLTPFYGMVNQSYKVYWDVFTPPQWEAKEAEYREEQARQREIEARTVDAAHPGEEQNERDHQLAGENMGAGDFGGRGWRHAPDGWFAYTLKTLPDTPQELVVTYWGSDAGNREFDVLVDGVKIATQKLANEHPDQFFDVTYPLTPDMLRGKTAITVRFQAHPGQIAGGVFGVRVMKKPQP